MYSITITGDTIASFKAAVADLHFSLNGALSSPASATAKVKDEPKAPEKKTPPAEEKAVDKSTEPKETAASEPSVEIDFERDISSKVTALARGGKREQLVTLLDEYGVARASQVDKALWPELKARLDDLLG